MNHYQPKVLSTTAAGTVAAATLSHQILVGVVVGVSIILAAIAVRLLWRRRKTINQ